MILKIIYMNTALHVFLLSSVYAYICNENLNTYPQLV